MKHQPDIYLFWRHSGTEVRIVSSQQEGPGFESCYGLAISVWRLHVLVVDIV